MGLVYLAYFRSVTSNFFSPLINQVLGNGDGNSGKYPIVVSTWPFVDAVRAAWRVADGGFSAVDAVVEGCSTCEELRCDGTGGIIKYLRLAFVLVPALSLLLLWVEFAL